MTIGDRLTEYRKDLKKELENILAYWMQYTVDEQEGGFIGRIDSKNLIHTDAPKGAVLNSRILWTFSAAGNLTGHAAYRAMADRAYGYIAGHFIDREYGGVYWSVDYTGQPLDTKKQVYALSFAVYGLSEYYRCRPVSAALEEAISLYRAIVQHSHDPRHGGYIEALTRDWQELADLRLSEKDANEKKSMNTHLHVLEGFANLYRVWPDDGLKEKITELVRLFLDHIIDAQTGHLILFFDDAWNPRSDTISYGHDIEAAWLVQEAAEVIGDAALVQEVKQRSVQVAEAAARGLDSDGGLWYERDGATGHLVREKHSWPQAESMVGFFNAWQVTGNTAFLEQALQSWEFIRNYILDKKRGEWYWGIRDGYAVMEEQDKVGIWKCPYHNTRACMEIIRRIGAIENH